jgi:MATE family multidrug resistance protein
MVASFAIYLLLAVLLQQAIGVAGLWIALNLFFITRATIFILAVRRKLPRLFTA